MIARSLSSETVGLILLKHPQHPPSKLFGFMQIWLPWQRKEKKNFGNLLLRRCSMDFIEILMGYSLVDSLLRFLHLMLTH